MKYTYHYDSPLGGITLSSDGTILTGLWFDGQKYFGKSLSQDCREADLPIFKETVRWLDLYFDGHEPDFTPPLATPVSEFGKAVQLIMLSIPYGRTMTYGEIAAEIARQRGLDHMSAQAVGGAVGHNAISLLVPCHRVVGSNGSLTGYAGGLERKIKLLTLEKADMRHFFIPAKSTAP